MPYDPVISTQSKTPAGSSAYKTSVESSHSTTRKKHPYRWGTIVEIMKLGKANAMPFIKVRWEDTNFISNWIALEDHPLVISSLYSDTLEGLVGKYRVKVEMTNYSSNNALAKIVGERNANFENYDPQLPSRGVKLI
jgi:hypothetical protein